jgi:hypothetical protein
MVAMIIERFIFVEARTFASNEEISVLRTIVVDGKEETATREIKKEIFATMTVIFELE